MSTSFSREAYELPEVQQYQNSHKRREKGGNKNGGYIEHNIECVKPA